MILFERFDYHEELEFHDHKTVSVPKFHQVMHISHDIACAAGEGFSPSGDLSSYVNH